MSDLQPSEASTRWKILSIVLMSVMATGLVLAIGMAALRDSSDGAKVAAPNPAPVQREAPPARQLARADAPPPAAPRRPSSADIDHCNQVANENRNTTEDTIKDAAIGAATGAGLGAAGGAIAKGGHGAGKGAGIGGLLGVAAGTIYGLNESNKNDERSADAYRNCMAGRGF